MADLISRAAAIAEVKEYLQGLDSCISEPDLKLDGYRNGLQVAINELRGLPTVGAVPVVHGRWKLVAWHRGLKVVKCSICGKSAYGATIFCPNCAAKMDGEQKLAFADQSGAEYADNPTV